MNKTCSVEGCNKTVRSRGWCINHWSLWRHNGSPYIKKTGHEYRGSPIDRFWGYIGDTTDCWGWLGPTDVYGYGHFMVNRKIVKAHRFSYELHNREIPEGLVIDHLCKNKLCVNPDHLEAVTISENTKRQFIGHKKMYEGISCTECDRQARSRGYCNSHYMSVYWQPKNRRGAAVGEKP